ncbi:hypothetical protein Tco_0323280 [Tanacetum coccineum]
MATMTENVLVRDKENGEMLLDSINNDPFQFKEITILATETTTKTKRMQELKDLTPEEKTRKSCDIKATNIILLGLPSDIYTLVNHHKIDRDIWNKNENDANEVRTMRQRFLDPLALLANTYNPPPSYNNQKSQYNQQPSELPQYQPIIPTPQQHIYEPPAVQQQSHAQSTQLDSGFVVPSFLLTDDPIASLNKAMMCYNCKGESHIAKQCTAKKRVKDSEWFKENMLLAQAQEADHVDAFDSDCHEAPTASTIFMDRLSSASSFNRDVVGLTYDSDILSEVSHYDTYHV